MFHNKLTPTQRVGLVCPATSNIRAAVSNLSTDGSIWAHRPALILLFAKKFFRLKPGSLIPAAAISDRGYSRMRRTGQIFWLLAYDACAAPNLLPAFTLEVFEDWPNWEVVSSYSSATAPDSHGISCADPLFQTRKELESTTTGLRLDRQGYLITCHAASGV
jgi:hypothetical protein